MAAEATVERTEGQQVKGSLKVWNLEKGFGFMTCEDGGSDLFIHQSAISVAGERYRAISPGTALLCEYYVRAGKDTAKNVTNPDGTPLAGFDTRLEAAQKINNAVATVAAPVPAGMIGGKVKFMNKDKGFGFITPDDGGEDMFVHVGDVQGQRILEADEPVSYTTAVKKGDRAQAVQVVPLRPPAPAPAPVAYPGYPPAYGYPAPGPALGYPAYGAPVGAPQGYGAPQAPQGGGAVQSGSTAHGKVKWFNDAKGFGFLIPSNGGTEVYFKGSDVTGGGSLEADEAVTYENQSNQSGKVWAVSITRARGGNKRKAEGGYDDPYTKRAQYAQPSPYAQPPGPYGAPAAPDPYGAPVAQQQYGAPQYAQPQQAGYGAAPQAPEPYQQGYPPAPPQQFQQQHQPQQQQQQQQQYY